LWQKCDSFIHSSPDPNPPGKIINGKAMFQGRDLLKISEDELRNVRGAQISMIFQDPMTFFNPVIPIGRQVGEPLEIHMGLSKKMLNHEWSNFLRW